MSSPEVVERQADGRQDQAAGPPGRLSARHPFEPVGPRLVEIPEVGETPREPGPGSDGKAGDAGIRTPEIGSAGRQVSAQDPGRLAIVAQREVGLPEIEVRGGLQADIADLPRD